MKNKLIALFIAAIMLMTSFSMPLISIADTINGEESTAGKTTENIEDEQQGNDLEQAHVTLDKNTYEYSGEEIVPQIVVRYNDDILNEGIDYIVTIKNNTNVGMASLTVEGINLYQGEITKEFEITKGNISNSIVKTQYESYAFTKKAIKPAVTVSMGSNELISGRDYIVSYSNNVYPGTAKITITGKGNYSGKITKNFYIARVSNVNLKARGTNYLTISWKKSSYVTGYKLYRYDYGQKKWKYIKAIKGNKNTSCKIKELQSGTVYKYAVKTYYKKGTKVYNGSLSQPIVETTRPLKCQITSALPDALGKMTIKWKQLSCTGYQLCVATNSKFNNGDTYKIEKNTTKSKLIEGLVDDKTYYIKIRAYRICEGKTIYGSWSEVKKVKGTNSGWVNQDGKKYYYVNGKPFKGTKKISGEKYYFDESTGEMRGASKTMWNMVKNKTSNTKYLIALSRDMNRVVVYTGSKNNWTPKYYWKCSSGAKGTRTPKGSFLTPNVRSKLGYIGGHVTYTCWFATRITNSVFFHSVLYQPRSKKNIQDGRLGYSISHGCVRLSLDNAKWLYDNIQPGTRVVVY